MERQIKCRGKRLDNGEWVFGYLARPDRIVVFEIDEFLNLGTWVEYIVDPETVGQSLAINDKAGSEVFEDDLLSGDNGNIYQVIWLAEHAKFALKVVKSKFVLSMGLTFPIWHYLNNGIFDVIKIGNIHDNPELLEVQSHDWPRNGSTDCG